VGGEFGRRRRKIYGRRKSAEKNSAGHNPVVVKLLHEFQFHTHSRKSAENPPETSQPQIRHKNIRPAEYTPKIQLAGRMAVNNRLESVGGYSLPIVVELVLM